MNRLPLALLVLAGATLGTSCAPDVTDADLPPASPGLELGSEDYATARGRFATRLIRPGPANREREPLPVLTDAVATTYNSGPLQLRAFASPPRSSGQPRPAVLFLHGGFSLGAGHWAMTRPFREAGFVVLVPSLRGENGQAGACSLFLDEVADVLAAADHLATRPDVDPERIYLAGHSVGGTLTLLATLASGRFRAAGSFSGSPDQVEYTRNRSEVVPFDRADHDELRIRSPVAFATSFRCPVRLYFGEDEYWLQPATRRTAILAKRAGRDVAAVERPGGHETASPEGIKACIQFFRSR